MPKPPPLVLVRYGGAVGMLGFDGNVNTGLTLRTVRVHKGAAEVRTPAPAPALALAPALTPALALTLLRSSSHWTLTRRAMT